jgi:hypothetical protein
MRTEWVKGCYLSSTSGNLGCALRRVSCLGLEWRSVHPLPNPLKTTARSSVKVLIQLTDDAANGKQKADQSRLVGLLPDGRPHYIAF